MYATSIRTLAMLMLGLAVSRTALAGIVLPPGGGTVVTWTDGAMNGSWQAGGNWNVHVPEDGDAVILDDSHYNVVLYDDSARIRSLHVSDGIALYNFGNRLRVGNDSNDATTTITGNASGIVVSDIPGTAPALDTDYLELSNGAYLRMDGGRAQIDREVDMSGAVDIRGHGLLEVGGSGANALAFSSSSELLVQGGNLRLDMTSGGTIYFGGADIIVTDDDSDLIVDGDLSSPIADSLQIGAGNRVDFQSDWEVTGSLSFGTGGGEIVGGAGTVDDQLTVQGGSANITSNLHYTAASQATLHSFSTLQLGRVSAAAGHVTNLNTAATMRVNVPATGAQSVTWNGHIDANSANFEVNKTGNGPQTPIFVLQGSMDLGGSAFWGPTDLQGSAVFYQSGNMDVTGEGGRIQAAGARFTSGSSTTIFNGAELAVHTSARVDQGAAFHGSGELVIDAAGLLFAEDEALIDVDVINHGTVNVGLFFDSYAQVELADDYLQSESGTLNIDLAGDLTALYDRLTIGNDAAIDGTLQVTLRDGFEPDLGDDFLVLATNDGLYGTFSNALLPGLNNGLMWSMDYSPFALTLSVVEDSADANGDGFVNGADFLELQRGYGLPAPAPGDITGDGFVDADDFEKWQAAYGSAVPGPIAGLQGVPEPTTLALILGALAMWRPRLRNAR
jgi:hypothetical protein